MTHDGELETPAPGDSMRPKSDAPKSESRDAAEPAPSQPPPGSVRPTAPDERPRDPTDVAPTLALPAAGAAAPEAAPASEGVPVTHAADAGVPVDSRRGRRRSRKNAKRRRKAPWWELPALVLLAIGIAILVKSFVVQPFYIPSDSMEKTLHGCDSCHGDRILVNKPIYSLRDPHSGDIVVFHDPKDWQSQEPVSRPPSNPVVRVIRGFGQLVGFVPPDGQVLVKRVIAVGGQTIKGDARGHVMISAKGAGGPYSTLNEPYVYAPGNDVNSQPAFGPVTIPSGRLWVMGDHRTDSADSRFHCSASGGEGTGDDLKCDPTTSTVPVDDVIGKAVVIAWPPSRWRTLGTPSTFQSAALATAPALPGIAAMATVLPVVALRRRRRRS